MSTYRQFYFSLALLAVCCMMPTLPTFALDYGEAIANFKKNLHQEFVVFNLMSEKEASNLIESYIQRMENSLQIMQYYKIHNDCREYFDALSRYYQTRINHVMFSSRKSQDLYNNAIERLSRMIKESKALKELEQLDVQKEYTNTVDILNNLQKEYYNRLDVLSKIKIWLLLKIDRLLLSRYIICSSH